MYRLLKPFLSLLVVGFFVLGPFWSLTTSASSSSENLESTGKSSGFLNSNVALLLFAAAVLVLLVLIGFRRPKSGLRLNAREFRSAPGSAGAVPSRPSSSSLTNISGSVVMRPAAGADSFTSARPSETADGADVQTDSDSLSRGNEKEGVEATPSLSRPSLITMPQNESVAPQAYEVPDTNRVLRPQIGEPSAFAKRLWSDASVDWCQLAPIGQSNDVVCDIGTVGLLAVAATSMRGHKHKVTAGACQDAFSTRIAIDRRGNQYLISVVCDGLSSARFSQYGARRTAELLSNELKNLVESSEESSLVVTQDQISKALRNCREQLIPRDLDSHGVVGVLDGQPIESEFHTTVTYAIVSAQLDDEDNTSAWLGSIGDSPVFVLRESSEIWELISLNGSETELVDPATQAFPDTMGASLGKVELSEGDLLSLMTDGVSKYVRPRDTQALLGTYLARQWKRPVDLPTFINDVGFDLKSADDDRTVVAIWVGR